MATGVAGSMPSWASPHLELPIRLIEAGVPVFVAPPVPMGYDRRSEFFFPRGWQRTEPDVDELLEWRPGWAVCAVTGIQFDVLDVDPRNGGAASLEMLKSVGVMPPSFGEVSTPSGGQHFYIPRSHLRKSTDVWYGIDLQAGDDFEYGRGFVYVPPTVRRSKTLGTMVPYRETVPVDVLGCVGGEKLAQYLKFKAAFMQFYREPFDGSVGVALGREFKLEDPWADALLHRFAQIVNNLRNFPKNKDKTREKSEWAMLNRQAIAVGGLVSGSGLPEEMARAGLIRSVQGWTAWGWQLSELEYFINRGLTYGKTRPISLREDYEIDEWGNRQPVGGEEA